ncbi:MbtH family NRPS accessory protein [Niallia sp. NCCP-28]|uniref:MbtH family protein n=1 Tax=Niallia sp. NCCP-28 TaxID=2934712 RepID=UPI00208AC3D4|nr:MbtH family NRPS accessory protein [Niallia sp. NCCP-28]GKU83910.1 MbtH protein [Niallia sp. NCCP-28]
MYNPFENEQGNYIVLVNEERQYSLWPAAIAIPGGWNKEYGPEVKSRCQQFIEKHWQDMRPKSLSQAMDKVMS